MINFKEKYSDFKYNEDKAQVVVDYFKTRSTSLEEFHFGILWDLSLAYFNSFDEVGLFVDFEIFITRYLSLDSIRTYRFKAIIDSPTNTCPHLLEQILNQKSIQSQYIYIFKEIQK